RGSFGFDPFTRTLALTRANSIGIFREDSEGAVQNSERRPLRACLGPQASPSPRSSESLTTAEFQLAKLGELYYARQNPGIQFSNVFTAPAVPASAHLARQGGSAVQRLSDLTLFPE